MTNFIQYIKNLVASNKLDLAIKEMLNLIAFCESKGKDIKEGIKMDSLSFIQMSARYHELQKQKHQSTLDNNALNVEKNDLTVDFMSLLASFEEDFSYPEMVSEYMKTKKVPQHIENAADNYHSDFSGQSGEIQVVEKKLQSFTWIIGALAAVLLALVLFLLYDYEII